MDVSPKAANWLLSAFMIVITHWPWSTYIGHIFHIISYGQYMMGNADSQHTSIIRDLSIPRLSVLQLLRYDIIEEFNVDSKAECDQFNLAHETKTKNASVNLVQYRLAKWNERKVQTAYWLSIGQYNDREVANVLNSVSFSSPAISKRDVSLCCYCWSKTLCNAIILFTLIVVFVLLSFVVLCCPCGSINK